MNTGLSGKDIEVLLVEDNPGDVRLVREALRECPVSVNLSVVQDGMEAMAFLRREGRCTEAPHPDLILLDLNLPRKDGREVLAEVKEDPDLKRIPVVVLTTSVAEDDILRSYELHASAYVAKPVELEQFVAVLRSLHDFWFNTATLPPT